MAKCKKNVPNISRTMSQNAGTRKSKMSHQAGKPLSKMRRACQSRIADHDDAHPFAEHGDLSVEHFPGADSMISAGPWLRVSIYGQSAPATIDVAIDALRS